MLKKIIATVQHTRRAFQCVSPEPGEEITSDHRLSTDHHLACEFNTILEQTRLIPHFMPIIATNQQQIFGHEALIRGPEDSPLHMPVDLFAMADSLERTRDLEVLCRKLSLEAFSQYATQSKLFLNVSPHCLLDPEHPRGATSRLMNELNIDPNQVVIEITENLPISDYDIIVRAVDHYRSKGFEVAIDDLGAGHSGLRAWFELKPDYVKLDRCFLKDIATNPLNQDFVRSMIRMAHDTGCKVVAEGIETPDVLLLLRDLQVDFMQGFFIGTPTTLLKKEVELPWPPVTSTIPSSSPSEVIPGMTGHKGTTLAELVQWIKPVEPDILCQDVVEIFRIRENLRSLPVIQDGKPKGIIYRNSFLGLFLSAYGHSLYDRKPIDTVMDTLQPVFEQDTPLEQVSQTLTSRRTELQESEFIVTRNGMYKGVVNVMDLLRRITQLQVLSARNTNPLTMLPGNGPIQETVEECLQQRQPFAIAYCDLDNFKPYNDIYGFSKGDAVIRATAMVLMSHLDRGRDFLGHIGGDDFIMILRSGQWEQVCQDCLTAFAAMVPRFYDEDDVAAGGIRAANRQGNPTFFGLLSLSIGIATPDVDKCRNYFEVATLASQAKKEAKKQEGNSLFVNRRLFVNPAGKLPVPRNIDPGAGPAAHTHAA
ncbi:MAG: EAL and GGDEF domain-containing protein [Magnetococcales bacterium]|nr:EAL and GGDEF domain-containing protein [Magnetococcales bacterium]MBF0149701.1 EAL and GGDEF domain-containing protein [Magnetococcales bacterium]MBF0174070.1 EAL and GGDEF domain-containing protein [Magnetococcales bacterium]MBF0630750.1 EAL and GGDEF domain-containing protein [Magnetococcales bacterium]